jgi:hypothetical protein
MKSKIIRTDKIKYIQLSELGSRLNLNFSNHEMVDGRIIGLDIIKRKLLIMEETSEINQINIIPLDEVSSISVKKIYSSIKPGELRKRKVCEFLKSMVLQLDFGDSRETVVVPFYENEINNIDELPDLERKVRNWQVILSKIIGRQNNILVQEKRHHSLVG